MAKNWSAAEAARVVFEGTDKAAIQDIGKRFPLFLSAASRGTEGLLEIIGALHPERVTVRTVESKLKEDVGEYEEEEAEKPTPKGNAAKNSKSNSAGKGKGKSKPAEDEEDDDDDEEEDEKPAKRTSGKDKGKAAAGKGKGKAKPEPEEEDEDDDDDEDEDDGLEDMSLTELKKEARKRKVDIKGLRDAEDIIEAIRDAEEEDDEDEDDDEWDI